MSFSELDSFEFRLQIYLNMENNAINLYKTLKRYANYRDKLFYDEGP